MKALADSGSPDKVGDLQSPGYSMILNVVEKCHGH